MREDIFFLSSSQLFACLHDLLLHSTAVRWSIKLDNLLTCNFCLLMFIHRLSIKRAAHHAERFPRVPLTVNQDKMQVIRFRQKVTGGQFSCFCFLKKEFGLTVQFLIDLETCLL